MMLTRGGQAALSSGALAQVAVPLMRALSTSAFAAKEATYSFFTHVPLVGMLAALQGFGPQPCWLDGSQQTPVMPVQAPKDPILGERLPIPPAAVAAAALATARSAAGRAARLLLPVGQGGTA